MSPAAARPCILVVDDEEQHRHIASYVLRKEYRVLTAAHAEEAMAVARANVIDLALVDYRMPGATGVSFLAQLRQVHPECIRFLVTAYSDESVLREAINEAGVYRFVSKPVNFTNLEMDMRRALEHRALQAQAQRGERLLQASERAQAAAFDLEACLAELAAAEDLLARGTPAEVAAARATLAWTRQVIASCSEELTAATRGEVPPYALDVGPVAEIVAATVAAQAGRFPGRSFRVELPPALPAVRHSPRHLERLLAGLLRRAAAATPEHGHIVVRGRIAPEQGLTVEVLDDGPPPSEAEQAALRVPPGIDAPAQIRGVAAAQAAMRAHGGELTLARTEGVGTAFSASFPPAS